MTKLEHSDPNCRCPSRRSRAPLVAIALGCAAIVAATSFAAGYRAGAMREGRQRLNEFILVATEAGILDYDHLAELADSPPLDQ